jgi:hypothetical protein
MTTIVTRAGKGSALTHNEVDANFTNLNNAKYESGDSATLGASSISANTTTDALRITQTGTGNAFVVEDSSSPDSSPFVIDSDGRVINGSTTSVSADDGDGDPRTTWGFQANSTLVASAGYLATYWANNDTGAGGISIGKSRGAAVGTREVVQNNDQIGFVGFVGDDGTNFLAAASLSAEVDGTPGTGDMPGRLVFRTTADGTSTPVERMRIDSGGRVLIGGTTPVAGAANGSLDIQNTSDAQLSISRFAASTASANFYINKSRGASVSTNTLVASGDTLGGIIFRGADGTGYIQSAAIRAAVDGTPGTNDMPGRLVFSTTPDGSATPVERMRITSAGNVGIGGSGLTNRGVMLQRALNNSTTEAGFAAEMQITSIVTSQANIFSSTPTIENATFTLSNLRHFYAQQGTKGASATITNQVGFVAESNLTGATNNYGFYGNIASATGRWNFYANGTAPNYFEGDVRTNTALVARAVPANLNTSATITAATMLSQLRTGTPTANINYTLPTGTNMDSAFQDLQVSQSFEWSVINLAAATHVITVVANTDHTVVGNMAVAANSSARFITRKTATNTFITYRGA